MLDGPVEKKKVCQLLVPLAMIVDSMGKPNVPLYLQRAYLHFVDIMYIHNSQMAQFEPPDFCLSILLSVRRVFDAMEASSRRKAQGNAKERASAQAISTSADSTPSSSLRSIPMASQASLSQLMSPKDEAPGTLLDAGSILQGAALQGAEIAELRTARLEYCRVAMDWLVSLYSTHVSYFHTTSDPLYEIIAALDTLAQAISLIFGTAECYEQALNDEVIGKLLKALAPLFYVPVLKALHITRQTLLEFQTTKDKYTWLNEYLMHVWEADKVDKSETSDVMPKIARLASLLYAMGTLNASSASQPTGAEISADLPNPTSRLQSMLTHTPIGANEEIDQALIDGLRSFQQEVMEHWHRSRREGVRQAALKPVVVAKPVENTASMFFPMRLAVYSKQLFQTRLQRLRPALLVAENKFMFDVANPKSSFHSVVPTGPISADPFEAQLANSTAKVLEEAVDAKVDVENKRSARPGFKVLGNATEVSFAKLMHQLVTTIGFYVMVLFPFTERLRWVLLRRWWETTKRTVSKWFKSVFRCFEQTDDEKERFLSVPPPSIERPALLMPLADIELVLERLLMLMR
jgi:hypothetical protein